MHFKGWLGTSMVLILALSATMALFYYWDNENRSAIQALQNRVNEMDMGRVFDRGGKRLYQQTQTMAKQVGKWLQGYQRQVENLADDKVFRLDGRGPAKRALMQARLNAHPGWVQAFVTDSRGKIIATAGERKPAPKVDARRFALARVQRSSSQALATVDASTRLMIMVPCLSNASAFLGALQVAITLQPDDLKKNASLRGLFTFLGDDQGRLYIGSERQFKVESMDQLIGQPPKKVADLIMQAGPKYFKAHWKNKNYILAVEPLEKQALAVYVLMPVSGFEKALASSATLSEWFNNPIILGGYAIILLLTLLLLTLVSGGNLSPLSKINRQLAEKMEEEELLRPLEIKSKGAWEHLVFYINTLIEKIQTLAATPSSPVLADTEADEALREKENQYTQERQRWENDMDELRTQLYQAQQARDTDVQEKDNRQYHLQQQLEELQQKNDNLQQALNAAQQAARNVSAAPPRISPEDMEIVEIIKQSGALRIEAIAHMSEDLKATLMVIKNYISSILSSEEGKFTDAQQEFLGDVINKSARLERQINDLLDISHMESEGTEWYTTATDLVAMLQDVVLNIQPLADTKQIKITSEIEGRLPLIKINSDRMGQVFIILVQHAIKITPFSGEVKITATETLSDVVVKVRDGGTPLSQEQISHVFSAYNGQDSKAGADYAGTGLRFAIISQIVKLHHGSITMRSLPEVGNEAVVTMPKNKVVTDEQPSQTMTFSSTTLDTPPQMESAPAVPTGIDTISSGTPQAPNAAAPAEPKAVNPMEAYEVKAIDEKKEKTQKKKEQDKDVSPYDLSAFMGNLGQDSGKTSMQVPGASEDLDELLKDIENINGQLDS